MTPCVYVVMTPQGEIFEVETDLWADMTLYQANFMVTIAPAGYEELKGKVDDE